MDLTPEIEHLLTRPGTTTIHRDEELEEVEEVTPEEGEVAVRMWSPSHRVTSTYYVYRDLTTGMLQGATWTPSAMNECRSCEAEWNDAHPRPTDCM